jgi:hypothetical protein
MTCCLQCGQTIERQAQAKPYCYTESGLTNVFWDGMMTFYYPTCQTDFLEIENVPALHVKSLIF